jgi:hypothetical protein
LLGDGLLLLPQGAQPRAPARKRTPAVNLFFGERCGTRGFGIDCAYGASLVALIWSFRARWLRSSAMATFGTVVILRIDLLDFLAGIMPRTGFKRFALTWLGTKQSQRDSSKTDGVSCACGKLIFLANLTQRSLQLRQFSDAEFIRDDTDRAERQRQILIWWILRQRRLTSR